MHKHLVLNDMQIPYQDNRLLGAIVRAGHDVEPNQIDLLGDVIDLQCLSLKHTELPKDERARLFTFQVEQTRTFLQIMRGEFPQADIRFYEGNHEERLDRYLRLHAKALYGAEGTTLQEQLHLDELDIRWHPLRELVRFGKFHLTHGDLIRQHSGYTARAMLDKYGVCLMHGHSHRGGAFYRTAGTKTIAAWENFCTCRLDQPYVRGCANWQQGFSVVYNDLKHHFHVQQVPVVGGRFVVGNTEYVINSSDAATFAAVKQARV